MAITIESLLKHGYFPRELPPPFNTKTLAAALCATPIGFPRKPTHAKPFISTPVIHNLARPGQLRRRLSIPNPVNQFELCCCIADNWEQIVQSMRSPISLSRPTAFGGGRAIGAERERKRLRLHRARVRGMSRFTLVADVSRCFPSIYTHSIPWAIHTKAVAKANRGPTLLGNELDRLVRQGQDQQTVGIPIGPDTSFVLAELVLSAIDSEMWKERSVNGFRFVDDYEFGFKTLSEAEAALVNLESSLGEYELALNPHKTRIAGLPISIEETYASELRVFPFREAAGAEQSDLIRYFDRAFELSALSG